jgi:hypothetical protein
MRRAPSRPIPSVLAVRRHTRRAVLRCWLDGDAVVLARRSVVGRRREIADSGAFGGTHSTGCRMRICVLWGQAWRCPCLLELHAPNN